MIADSEKAVATIYAKPDEFKFRKTLEKAILLLLASHPWAIFVHYNGQKDNFIISIQYIGQNIHILLFCTLYFIIFAVIKLTMI